jgi:hypothetical protein
VVLPTQAFWYLLSRLTKGTARRGMSGKQVICCIFVQAIALLIINKVCVSCKIKILRRRIITACAIFI